MSRVLVSGSVAYDRIMDFPDYFSNHFVPGKLHNLSVSFQVESFEEHFGGTAGNIAYGLALLGEEPVILSTTGTDFEKYRAHLESRRVETGSIRIGADVTACAYIMTDKADNQIAAYYPGAGRSPYEGEVRTEGASLAIVAAGCRDDMQMLPPLLRARDVRYLYDPGQQITALSGDELLDAISGAGALFANDYELGLIVFKTGFGEAKLLERVPVIVATLGDRGARLITKDGEMPVAAVRAERVVDPTGAGDAHRAGFIKGMLAGLPLNECAQLGSAVATYAVESFGTQNYRFTFDELKARYEKAYGEKLALE